MVSAPAKREVLFHRVLKETMRGDDIRELQELLKEFGFLVGPVDGHYGPLTVEAVKAFQKVYGLRPDGVAGPITLGMLRKEGLPVLRKIHVVEEGEDIFRIAEKEGTTARALMLGNRLKRPGDIYPGEELIIHQREIYLHLSERGEGEREAVLLDVFKERYRGCIQPGIRLVLPGVNLAPDGYLDGEPQLERYSLGRAEMSSSLNPRYLLININLEAEEEGIFNSVISKVKWRKETARRISSLLSERGFTGLDLHLGEWSRGFKSELRKFLKELSMTVAGRNQELIVSLPSSEGIIQGTSDPRRDGRFDPLQDEWRVVGRYAHKVMVPLYRNVTTESPGPIAPYDRARAIVRKAISLIPSWKVIAVMPSFACDWVKRRDTLSMIPLSFREVFDLIYTAGYRVLKDHQSRSPSFKYRSHRAYHEVWFENGWSLGEKLNLVIRYNLLGVALGEAAVGSPEFWEEVAGRFRCNSDLFR